MESPRDLEDRDYKVLFHDAVRPLVSPRIITECFEALDNYDAVDVAIPSADTIIEVDRRQHDPRRSRRAPTSVGARRPRRSGPARSSGPTTSPAGRPELRGHRRLHRRAALPPRHAHLGRHGRRAQHEGHRADRRVHRRQALPARPASGPRGQHAPRRYRAALEGKTVVVFGGSYGIGADIAELARSYGADVFAFSRSGTSTHVERRADVAKARADRAGEDRADRLRGQHRRGPPPRRAHRDVGGDGVRRDRGELPRAGVDRPGVRSRTSRAPGAACCSSPPAPTRAAAAATASTPRRRRPW